METQIINKKRAVLSILLASSGCAIMPDPGKNVVVDAGRYVVSPLALGADVVGAIPTGLTVFFNQAGKDTEYRAYEKRVNPDGSVTIDVTSPFSYGMAEIFGGIANLVRLPSGESAWLQEGENPDKHFSPYWDLVWPKSANKSPTRINKNPSYMPRSRI